MTQPETNPYVAALARAVAVLRRSREPQRPQKDALRALVAVAAERSATFRFYGGEVTLDGAAVSAADPRLAAFVERLAAQHVAEITIAKGAGPDELLALAIGLAADPGQGRIKERLRDAGSARVMVVLHQYDELAARSVSAAFEKVKLDQGVLAEWNKSVEQGARSESERVAAAGPVGPPPGATRAKIPPRAVPIPTPKPPEQPERAPRRSVFQEASTPDAWFAAFERGIKAKLQDQFGDTDWDCHLDRAAGTIVASDPQGRSSISVPLPPGHLQQSAWLLAGKLLADLRKRAETEGALRKRR